MTSTQHCKSRCLRCYRTASVQTDIGRLCWACNLDVARLETWLYTVMRWRPMTRDERRLHDCGE